MPVAWWEVVAVAGRALVGRDQGVVGRYPTWVGPGRIDANLHLNYAAYLELMELARWDWSIRTGQARDWVRGRVRPLVGSLQIEYRRELPPLASFVVETRAVGFERRALLVEQCFVRRERVHCRAVVNVLVQRRGGGLLDRAELEGLAGRLVVEPRAE